MSKHYLSRLIVAIALLVLVTPMSQAVVVPHLASATVAVDSRSHQVWLNALPQAYAQALIKLSGNPGVMTVAAIQQSVSSAANKVISYSYQSRQDGAGHNQLFLNVIFDQKALRALLRQANQAIWGKERPLSLVWLSVPQEMTTVVLASNMRLPLVEIVKQQAMQRGLPIILPMMDLQDQNTVTTSYGVLPNQAQLQAEAVRYGVKSIVAGVISADQEGQFTAQWTLIVQGTPYRWQASGADVASLAAAGINRVAELMASQQATLTSQALQTTVAVTVDGVRNLQDYVHVLATLKSLNLVNHVAVVDMSHNVLSLTIRVNGDAEALAGAMSSLPHLQQALVPPQNQQHRQVDLAYHWLTPHANQARLFSSSQRLLQPPAQPNHSLETQVAPQAAPASATHQQIFNSAQPDQELPAQNSNQAATLTIQRMPETNKQATP